MSNSATVFCKEKTRAFYPDSINMEKKFPQMPVSIPSIWKTILKDSLKLIISAPDQIHFWNPIQYLEELYRLHRMGFLAATSRMWSEQNLTNKGLAVKSNLVPIKTLSWQNLWAWYMLGHLRFLRNPRCELHKAEISQGGLHFQALTTSPSKGAGCQSKALTTGRTHMVSQNKEGVSISHPARLISLGVIQQLNPCSWMAFHCVITSVKGD